MTDTATISVPETTVPPSPVAPSRLRCEYLDNPLGLDDLHPRLSWIVGTAPEARGTVQSAYQILVASALQSLDGDAADIWDSGKVSSDQNAHISYSGPRLLSRQRYYWKVRTWDGQDASSAFSASAFWEMGLLKSSDWIAQWIGGTDDDPSQSCPCPYLRKGFAIQGTITRARAYVSALGLYELSINGHRVGQDYFTPGWTDYDARIQYQTYDVTALLQSGENAVGAILGDGWFCGHMVSKDRRNVWGHPPRLLAQLVIEYADGGLETIVTDASWTMRTGPILASDFYNGETYDARREMPGWDQPRFNDSDWAPARIYEPSPAILCASRSPMVRRIQELKPIAMTEPTPGAYVFDLGQNMVGWARLPVEGPAGTTVTLRFAEMLNPDGTIYTANLRGARCTDQYTLKGGGREIYEPHFTFHGFRYVELTGYPGRPAPDALTGIVLHSDTPPTGTFECSNPMLNQLQHNIIWGQKGNFLEVPTDCPQRDERLGWTGDAQVFIRTACFNADVAAFFSKWITDLTDAQSPEGVFPMVVPNLFKKQVDGGAAWADAGIICPWTLYLCYGDKRILDQHYAAMARYLDAVGKLDPTKRHCFGDWLNLNDETARDLIAVAFHAHGAQLMGNIAEALGRKRDTARYRKLFKQIKARFNKEFVTLTGRLVSGSQTAYVLALHFDLLPDRLRDSAIERLVQRIHQCKDHLSTGFVGTPYLLPVLAQTGHLDLAYKLLLNEDFPSWGYPIKHGATTMWERWDGWRHDKGFQDPAMNSFNHYAYGAVGDWMYRTITGIDLDPSQSGYRHILIHPRPAGGLTSAKASLDTLQGTIECDWSIDNNTFTLNVTIPANAKATIRFAAPSLEAVTETGQPVAAAPGISNCHLSDTQFTCETAAGRYRFTTPAPDPAAPIAQAL